MWFRVDDVGLGVLCACISFSLSACRDMLNHTQLLCEFVCVSACACVRVSVCVNLSLSLSLSFSLSRTHKHTYTHKDAPRSHCTIAVCCSVLQCV